MRSVIFRSASVAVSVLFATAWLSLAAKPESTGPDPDALLRELYKVHDTENGPFADRTKRAGLEKYFTKELSGLIVKDAVASKGEMGAIEFDPLYESQDPVITGLKVGEVNWGGIVKHGNEPEDGLAVVEVTFKDSGKPRSIVYRFHQNKQKGWKIADINYSDGQSIVGLLRGDGAGPNGGNAAEPE